MYDTLTLDELYDLHAKLGDEGQRLHDKFMALPTTISEEANLLMAKCAEVSETMGAVYAVILVRQAEARITFVRLAPDA